MIKIEVNYFDIVPHISQILTGFCMLQKQEPKRFNVSFNLIKDPPVRGAYVDVRYSGKRIIYDTMDGYQCISDMKILLAGADFYFKRSFSEEKNEKYFKDFKRKIYPLGFNYHVSCKNHPMDKPYYKEVIKSFLHLENNLFCNTYFSTARFEEVPTNKNKKPVVLFVARLWEPDEAIPVSLREERKYINDMRIRIIRELKKLEGIQFIGGLSDNEYTRKVAPDLILPEKMTNRKKYLKIMHKADICIATMGLHESIGWKMGEYVSASKAIISEKMHYKVPGNFEADVHYLNFSDAKGCIDAVLYLIENPDSMVGMKKSNHEYYNKYLSPVAMVNNSIEIVNQK